MPRCEDWKSYVDSHSDRLHRSHGCPRGIRWGQGLEELAGHQAIPTHPVHHYDSRSGSRHRDGSTPLLQRSAHGQEPHSVDVLVPVRVGRR